MTRLVAIVGPTASGKSALAMRVAERTRGEIICADSRTIYRGMDIGTAKPGEAEQARVPHHLLDIVDPNESYSAAEFKARANQVICEIEGRHHLPILVGGSGLYLYGVLYDYGFPAGATSELRSRLEVLTTDQLIDHLAEVDPEAHESVDLANRRRLIRAIETAGVPKEQSELRPQTLLIGLRPDPAVLQERIEARAGQMVAQGLASEVERLITAYGPDLEVLKSPGYSEVVQLINGEISEAQATRLIALHTLQLAKRQLTWFKRNPDIEWFEDSADAERRTIEFIGQDMRQPL